MHFCPCCGNLLLIQKPSYEATQFCCPTCPYIHKISSTSSFCSKTMMKRKQVDDVLGGDSAWENVDRTEAKCPYCNHNEAFFMQIQIRSADEPSTIFYRCCNCSKQWND